MSEDVDCISEFANACESLLSSKYIVADTKIAPILKSIAKSKYLYALFSELLKGFDYEKEYATATERGEFSLPFEHDIAVALVFRILVDIDSGVLPYSEFLDSNFKSDSASEEFARFCLEAVKPFEEFTKEIFNEVDISPITNDNINVENALAALNEIITRLGDTEAHEPELQLILDAMSSAIIAESALQRKTALAALTYALKDKLDDAGKPQLAKISQCLGI